MPFLRNWRPITQYYRYSDLRVSCLCGCAIFIMWQLCPFEYRKCWVHIPTLTLAKCFATFPQAGNNTQRVRTKVLYGHNGMMKLFFGGQIVSACSDGCIILKPFSLKHDRHLLEVAAFWIHLGIITETTPSYFLCMSYSWG